MAKRLLALLVVCTLITVSFSGCFGKMKEGQAFSMPITDEPTSLDPQIADSNAERLVAANCYEGLMAVDETGALIAGVAERYTVSGDGLQYTFYLRQNANWALFSGHAAVLGEDYKTSFDTTVYAEDFVFALRRAVDPQTVSPDAYLFSSIAGAQEIMQGQASVQTLGVQATDAFTLQITLAYPDESFLYALLSPGAMPCDEAFFNLTNGRYGLEAGYSLSNGPLHVSRWAEKTSLKMVKNQEYAGARTAKPATFTLYYNEDADKIPEKMAAGTYDAAFLTQNQLDAMEDTSALTVQSMENTTYAFLFNLQNTSLANENLRKALCFAVQPNKTEVFGANTTAAQGLVPPYCTIGATAYRSERGHANMLSFDEAAAKACFDEALLELGVSSVELEVLCEERYGDYVRQTVQTWQRLLGVKFVATVKTTSPTMLQAGVTDGSFSVVLYPLAAGSASVSAFLETFGSEPAIGFSDHTYDGYLRTIRESAGSFAKLQTACAVAEDYLLQHAVLLPVCYQGSCFVTSVDTSGIYFYSSRDYVYFINATKK